MVGMNPGEFREKIEFLSVARTSNGSGGYTSVLTTAYNLSAKITTDRAVYNTENNKLQLEVPYKVIIRYNSCKIPTVDMIVKWRNVNYRILAITDLDVTKRYIELRIVRQG